VGTNLNDIALALEERAQELERQKASAVHSHRIELAKLKKQRETEQARQEAEYRTKVAEHERIKREKKEAAERELREEAVRRSEKDMEYAKKQAEIDLAAKKAEELRAQMVELENNQAKAKQAELDYLESLKPKVNSERIMPNPMQRFFQAQE
jgi:hypothetical protein